MPITFEVDAARRRVVAVAEGRIGIGEMLAHVERQRSEGILDLCELVDGTRAHADITGDDVRRLVSHIRSLGERYALGPAAVVVRDDVTFGMLRMLGMLVEDACDVQPFRSPNEAETWLGSIPGPRPARPPG